MSIGLTSSFAVADGMAMLPSNSICRKRCCCHGGSVVVCHAGAGTIIGALDQYADPIEFVLPNRK
jgi:UDP-N-acetylglucosamine transferase subunit ALG13